MISLERIISELGCGLCSTSGKEEAAKDEAAMETFNTLRSQNGSTNQEAG
jgi:hypothetical protein